MRIIEFPTAEEFVTASKRPAQNNTAAREVAAKILAQVREGGMASALALSRQYDKSKRETLAVSNAELRERAGEVDAALVAALKVARRNIEIFHAAQAETPKKIETTAGVTCWRKTVPIENVGLYIPGGTAPLFSTALMLAVPAKLAGCKRIVLCTPPDARSSVPPAIAYLCLELGIEEVYCIGGAQAIGLLAFGAGETKPVFKIFGPGNQYVTCAKEIAAQGGITIDMPAGPSEVLVIADRGANPAFCAADLLSQAEHGPDSQVVFITDDEALLRATVAETDRQCAELPRASVAAEALKASCAVLARSLDDAMRLSNLYAPEHLILAISNPEALLENVTTAASVFLGYNTPESFGDYASGTNHTLPTSGFARTLGGISLQSFLRSMTVQQASPAGLKNLAPTVVTMARAEGLEGHARAVEVRLEGK